MRGYCEACRREMSSEEDEYGAPICVDCGSDLIADIHVQEYASFEEAEEEWDDFNPFFQRD